jgi:hypothetical protein
LGGSVKLIIITYSFTSPHKTFCEDLKTWKGRSNKLEKMTEIFEVYENPVEYLMKIS